MSPKFSFIIPSKNEEKYIGRCLSSIRRQRGSHEIIVVDSYSTDNTVKIARKYGSRVLFERKKGPAAARNKGAKAAKGDILVFTDADVVFGKDFLEKLGRKFRGISGCVFRVKPYDAKSFPEAFVYMLLNNIMRIIFTFGFVMTPGSCFVYDRKIFQKTGGFNPKMLTNEDHDMARRASKFGQFRYFSDVTVNVSARRVNRIGIFGAFILYPKSTLLYFLNKRYVKDYWST
jgi:glycosyltransferase involved in cell wall biosynthesis